VARGIQNKVLEAMAMALPVVCTPQALEGIEAGEVELAADAPSFAAAVLRLLAAPDEARALGQAARQRVLADHAWPSRLARIEALLSPD
ncbi:MAG: glycosyltransferase, partial [Alphaproteobacteria bacterium]|nr:glycosyltransferase [Alphaproteobacteria bacterium]